MIKTPARSWHTADHTIVWKCYAIDWLSDMWNCEFDEIPIQSVPDASLLTKFEQKNMQIGTRCWISSYHILVSVDIRRSASKTTTTTHPEPVTLVWRLQSLFIRQWIPINSKSFRIHLLLRRISFDFIFEQTICWPWHRHLRPVFIYTEWRYRRRTRFNFGQCSISLWTVLKSFSCRKHGKNENKNCVWPLTNDKVNWCCTRNRNLHLHAHTFSHSYATHLVFAQSRPYLWFFFVAACGVRCTSSEEKIYEFFLSATIDKQCLSSLLLNSFFLFV